MNGILNCAKRGLYPVLFFVLLLTGMQAAEAANKFAVISGIWNQTVPSTIWDTVSCAGAAGGAQPNAGDRVVICSGVTVTAVTTSVNDLTVLAGGILQGSAANPTLTLGAGGGEDVSILGTINFSGATPATIFLNKNSKWGCTDAVTGAGTTSCGTLNLSVVDLAVKTLTFTAGNTFTINMSGAPSPLLQATNAAAITSLATTTWNFNGTALQTLPNNLTGVIYGNLTTNNAAGVTLGNALTAPPSLVTNLLGDLTVASGILNNGGFAINGVAGATFTVANGTTFNLTGTSTMATGFGTRTFGQGSPLSTPPCSTVNYGGTAQTVSNESYGNLTLSGSGAKTLPATAMTVACNFATSGTSTATAAQALTVGGNFTIGAGTTFDAATFTHNVAGNFFNSGTFTASTSTFNFNGSSVTAQNISGSPAFNNLTINNSGGGIALGSNVTVNNILTLTNGVVTTGANTLISSANCPASVVRTSGRVFGNLQLTFPATNPITCIYPVGDSNNYAPITLTKTGANSGTLTGSSTSGDHADTTAGTSGINAARSVNRYWTLTGGTLVSGTPYSATFQFCSAVGAGCGVNDVDAAATTANFIVAKKTSGSWTLPTVGSATSTTTQATGLITFGEFAVGERALDHYEMTLQTSSITCLPSTVTVTACTNTSSPCSSLATAASGTTATLTTSAGTLAATTVIFNASGVASTTLSYPAAANGATASVTLSGEQIVAANLRKCCPDGVSCVVGNSCSSTFNTAGFIFSSAADGVAATLPTQVAGTSSLTYYLRAIKTSTTTKACETALSGPNTVNFAYECNNPTTCFAANLMSVNGGSATTIARNNNGSVLSYTPVSMTFDANGNAPFTFNYSDVGLMTLYASKTVNSAPLTGASNAFVVKPFGFVLSNIKQTAAPNLVNPAALNASGNKFVKAGEDFSVTVTAVTATSSTAPNYGRETVPEGVVLTKTLVAPAAGNNPALGNPAAFGAFSNGVATGTTFNWSEVGIITLTPSVADGNYLGVGDIIGTTSANVGRFYPEHFDTTVIATATTPMPCPVGLTCPALYNGFIYSGQPFSVRVFARNLAGGTTTNYDNPLGFSKAVTLAAWDALGSTVTQNPGSGTLANNPIAVTAFSAGVATAVTPTYTFAATPTAPTDIYMRADDAVTDIVSSLRAPSVSSVEGGVKVVSGKVKISNAHGSEVLPLPMTATVQYYNSTIWLTSITDSVSNLTFGLSNYKCKTGCAWTTTPTPGSGTVASGALSFKLSKPSTVGGTGSVDVTISAPSYLLAGSNGGRATFGVYKGANEIIDLRENY